MTKTYKTDKTSWLAPHALAGLVLVCALSLTGCTIRPRGVLSNREMVDLLVDLHKAEGTLQVAGYNYGHDEDVKAYYGIVLEKHGVTQAVFDSSLVWYTHHPAYFQSVYPKVIKRLTAMHDSADRLMRQDSDARSGRSLEETSLRRDTLTGPLLRTYRYGTPHPLYQAPQPAENCMDSLYRIQKMQKKDDFSEKNTKKFAGVRKKV